MFTKASKFQVIPSIFIFLWIFLINIVTTIFFQGIEAWPMYFVTIFFFAMGGDKKNIASIFGGGITGIIFTWALCRLLIRLTPLIGMLSALIIVLFIALSVIIIGGNFCPVLLNNITFAYLTITTIVFDPQMILGKIIPWMLVLCIGGSIILGGAMLIMTQIPKMMMKNLSS